MSNVEARVDALERRVGAVEQKAERMEESFSPTGHYGLLISRHDKMLYVYSALATVAVMFAAGALGWIFSAVYELKGEVAGLNGRVATLERSVDRIDGRVGALATEVSSLRVEMKQSVSEIRAEIGARPGRAAPRSAASKP